MPKKGGLSTAKGPEARAGEETVRATRIRKLSHRVGERVVTQDGFFAKIVGVSCEDTLLLDLEVAGIGLRAGVPASQVTASGRRSSLLSAVRPTKSDEAARDFKMRLGLRIAAGPDAFFALADTKQEDILSPEGWLEACKSSLGNVDETLCRSLFDQMVIYI